MSREFVIRIPVVHKIKRI